MICYQSQPETPWKIKKRVLVACVCSSFRMFLVCMCAEVCSCITWSPHAMPVTLSDGGGGGRLALRCGNVPALQIDGVAQLDATARLQRVVISHLVIRVKELLEPLQELKVVLKTALYQLIYWYHLNLPNI